MARCENCIHERVCLHEENIRTDTYAYMGVSYDVEKCKHFILSADVAPKSEVALDVIRKFKNKVRQYKHNAVNPYDHIILYLNELEKKYTEEDKNEQ